MAPKMVNSMKAKSRRGSDAPQREVTAVESPAKKLRQQRAALGARQGDPEAPAGGTLFARRSRLQAELEQAQSEEFAFAGGSSASVSHALTRPLSLIERDLNNVECEIAAVQREIEDLDRRIKRIEPKNRG